VGECGYCGCELPEHDPHTAGRHREYCTDSHRVMASMLRKAERDNPMDPEVPTLIAEAYGTVTPPPEQDTPDEGEKDES
jgi:hypothetical protein